MSNGYEYEVPLPTSPIPSSPPPEDQRNGIPPNHRAIERERSAPQTRIPGPTPRQSSEPAQSQKPTTGPYRGGFETPALSASTSSASAPTTGRAQSSSRSQS